MHGGMQGPMHRGMGGGGMPCGMYGGMHRGGMMGGMHRGGMHGGMAQGGAAHGMAAPKGDDSAASMALAAVNAKMHRDMDITFTGDADADFARAMIAHHQGAIDMAKILLAFGKDEAMRKLAQDIVRSQEPEIALMREWLAKRGK